MRSIAESAWLGPLSVMLMTYEITTEGHFGVLRGDTTYVKYGPAGDGIYRWIAKNPTHLAPTVWSVALVHLGG